MSGFVKDLGFDETSLPVILTVIYSDRIPLHCDFDDVAINAVVGELGNRFLAFNSARDRVDQHLPRYAASTTGKNSALGFSCTRTCTG